MHKTGEKAGLAKTLLLPVLGDYAQFLNQPFIFQADTNPEQLVDLFKIVDGATRKQPSLAITLSRFNSCWLRSTDHDKVIDVSISLESLFLSQTEIAFKFSLFIAFIVHVDPTRREAAFRLLQRLYSARSSIVHGDQGKTARRKIAEALGALDEILAMARAAISYYALFLFNNEPDNWQTHIEQLVLGTTTRIA